MYPPHAAIIYFGISAMRREWETRLQEAYGRLRIPNVREALKAVSRLYILANADGRIEDGDEH